MHTPPKPKPHQIKADTTDTDDKNIPEGNPPIPMDLMKDVTAEGAHSIHRNHRPQQPVAMRHLDTSIHLDV